MNIIINNCSKSIVSSNLKDMVLELSIETKGVAIALNNRVIPKVNWGETKLSENDNIVVVSAVFGG